MRRRVVVALTLVIALVAAAVPAGIYWQHKRERDAQQAAATSFARAWRTGTLKSLLYAGQDAATVATKTQAITASLTSAATDVPRSVTVTSVAKAGDVVTAHLAVSWRVAGIRDWSYTTDVPLRKAGGAWRPVWSEQVLHPKLQTGQVLRVTRDPAARGEIIGADDQILVTERPVVVVGLQPSRAKGDITGAAERIAALVGVDATSLAQRAKAAAPDGFVEAITLRQEAYQAVRDQLQPIPGAVFHEEQRALAPTATFARALLGTVGPATADVVKSSGGRVRAGDVTGISGVQRTYDAWLSGTPGLTVRAVTPSGASAAATTLLSVAPVPGKPLHLTLDRDAQEAAEAALESATKPAALVAIRASTGGVLAVANGGPNASGYNRALLGQYPPGSTFKVVSTLALLQDGVTTSTPIDCPSTITISGKTFKNAESEVLGTVPFRTDFADSCNTAFVGSSRRITAQQLSDAARDLGYGRAAQALGVQAFNGTVPTTSEPVAHAAAMIGQGTVLSSPLVVASTSAAVAAGQWNPPRLVLDGQPGAQNSSGAPSTTATATATEAATAGGTTPSASAQSTAQSTNASGAASPTPLPPDAVAALRELMRAVVTSGTASALRSEPGDPIYGKTGTAEYGSADPPRTHAWFTGWQGDISFAVVVEDGGFGAEAAAPLAANFLARL